MPLLSTYNADEIEAGIDEAGRGSLAGPVVAAAVIFPANFKNSLINDSKALTQEKREQLKKVIINQAIAYGIGVVDNNEIDEINILNATYKAMHIAINRLKVTPSLLLIDGNRFKPYKNIPWHCFIKGDGKFLSIAAASVLAKTYRDNLMIKLHEKYPDYQWDRNKGYGTAQHRQVIREIGPSPLHRRSFTLNPQLKMRL
ncbi:MAG: ribonuclease HII [Bacteroidales bacterium]